MTAHSVYLRHNALIAYCYSLCLSTQAAKKALDTVEEFTKNEDPAFEIKRFMPTGFSKVNRM